MTNPPTDVPPGWYHAEGDPPGTQRFWDGRQWVGGPVPVQPPPGYRYGSRDVLPEIGRPLAEPWQRIVARLIDSLIVAMVAVVAVALLDPDLFGDTTNDLDEVNASLFTVTLLAVAWEVAWVALKGGTPGKLAMGIAVTTQRGELPPGWGPAFLRSVLDVFTLLGVLVYVIGLLEIASLVLLFADERHRTIPDRIAGTYVVKTR
ncbi:MAG TPA: RDD family protein [Acidimicrobiales bacterium]